MGKGPGKSYGCHSGERVPWLDLKGSNCAWWAKVEMEEALFVGSKGRHRADRAGYGWRGQRSNQRGHGGSSACDVMGWPRTTCKAGDKCSSLRHLAA